MIRFTKKYTTQSAPIEPLFRLPGEDYFLYSVNYDGWIEVYLMKPDSLSVTETNKKGNS